MDATTAGTRCLVNRIAARPGRQKSAVKPGQRSGRPTTSLLQFIRSGRDARGPRRVHSQPYSIVTPKNGKSQVPPRTWVFAARLLRAKARNDADPHPTNCGVLSIIPREIA